MNFRLVITKTSSDMRNYSGREERVGGFRGRGVAGEGGGAEMGEMKLEPCEAGERGMQAEVENRDRWWG